MKSRTMRAAAYGRCQVDSRRLRNHAERGTPLPPLAGGRISKDSPKRGSVILLRLGFVAVAWSLFVTVGGSSRAALVRMSPSPRAMPLWYPTLYGAISVPWPASANGADRPP